MTWIIASFAVVLSIIVSYLEKCGGAHRELASFSKLKEHLVMDSRTTDHGASYQRSHEAPPIGQRTCDITMQGKYRGWMNVIKR